MSSKREEEKNEKIIRGLMKLPPNRKCINCDSPGPQYVCTDFWTFICVQCSGIHREFNHRVKSVSMAKFTTQEVQALQSGGNQRARELFLREWDPEWKRPDSGYKINHHDTSKVDKIREFIRNVYVEKKYAGGSSSDKPPRDTQSRKNHEDHRRASSYHSYSQSPPYDHQYEERRYGKQPVTLSRKPGSDRGHYEGKISSFLYSPGRQGEPFYEDRFANDTYGSRVSDYSVSSTGDPFRVDSQSPNFQDTGCGSPPSQQVRDILIDDSRPQTLNTYSNTDIKRGLDGVPRPQRTASSGSFGSFDSNAMSLKSVNSGSLIDIILEPERASGTLQSETSVSPPLSEISASSHATNHDFFSQPIAQQLISSSSPPVDLFADVSIEPSSTTPSGETPPAICFSENVGWATFDVTQQAEPTSRTKNGLSSFLPPGGEVPQGNSNTFASLHDDSQWLSAQKFATHAHLSLMPNQFHVDHQDVKKSPEINSFPAWNAFDESTGSISQTSNGTLSQTNEQQILAHKPTLSDDPVIGIRASEVFVNDGFQKSAGDRFVTLNVPFNDVAGSSLPSSVQPLMGGSSQEQKSINPFDLPYDSEAEANGTVGSLQFLAMSSLQQALPNPELPTSLLGGLHESWFPPNSVTPFIASLPPGGLAYVAGQVPSTQLPNIPSQGPVASLGGNPFA